MRWKRVKQAGAVAGALALAVAAAQAATPAARAAMEPSVVAVSQVENLNNTVRGETGSYAGLWIDHANNTVYVSTTKSSVSTATVTALEPRATAGAATMKLVVVHAKYDFAQLAALAARVTGDKKLQAVARASHAMVSQWYPDPVTDKVVIGFTKVTAAERAQVRAEYGSRARVVAAPTGYVAVGKASVVAKEVPKDSPRAVHPDSRTDASAPWYGGEEVEYDADSWACSTGYEWGNGSISTAGHCGSDPTDFYNDNNYVGSTDTLQFGNGRIDMQRITGSTYDPDVWAGASGNTKEPVSGSGGVAIGGTYCTNGYVTGQNCTAVVYAIDVCEELWFDEFDEYVDDCDQDYAASSNLTSISLPGDSGGPVYTNTSIYDPYAVGTITGYGSDGAYAYWGDMYEEKVIFHLSPEVG